MSRELQQLNEQNKLAMWAGRISECRNSGLTVKRWCKENGVGEQTYYKWQKRVFSLSKAQHETQFAEVTPIISVHETVASQSAARVLHSSKMIDLHLSALAPRWRFLSAVSFDDYSANQFAHNS